MHLRLDGRAGALWLGDAVDELLGEAPDDILRGDHVGDQVFKLSGTLVVGHEPDADARAPLNHDSSGVGFTWQRDAPMSAAVTNRLPASGGLVIGIYDHSQHGPARHD